MSTRSLYRKTVCCTPIRRALHTVVPLHDHPTHPTQPVLLQLYVRALSRLCLCVYLSFYVSFAFVCIICRRWIFFSPSPNYTIRVFQRFARIFAILYYGPFETSGACITTTFREFNNKLYDQLVPGDSSLLLFISICYWWQRGDGHFSFFANYVLVADTCRRLPHGAC